MMATRVTGGAWAVYNPEEDRWEGPTGPSRELGESVLFPTQLAAMALISAWGRLTRWFPVHLDVVVFTAHRLKMTAAYETAHPGEAAQETLFTGG